MAWGSSGFLLLCGRNSCCCSISDFAEKGLNPGWVFFLSSSSHETTFCFQIVKFFCPAKVTSDFVAPSWPPMASARLWAVTFRCQIKKYVNPLGLLFFWLGHGCINMLHAGIYGIILAGVYQKLQHIYRWWSPSSMCAFIKWTFFSPTSKQDRVCRELYLYSTVISCVFLLCCKA